VITVSSGVRRQGLQSFTSAGSSASAYADESFGALPFGDRGVRFRLWAPAARELTLVLHTGRAAGSLVMGRDERGVFDRIVDEAAPGDLYSYRIDGGDPRPDPASRFQPQGVHGPSQVVAPGAYPWADQGWRGRSPNDLVVYELHVGTFSPEGTFAGATARLVALRDLGVTAIELMPVADFPGQRNWGYDGVSLFAPSRAYGAPDDLRRLVDEAHRLGLSVFLDVVYNHLGPEGQYLTQFNPEYMTDRHDTPWGQAVNLDGPGSGMVRAFIVANAVHWVREYHVDGLRLDATHALVDESPVSIVQEIAAAVRNAARRHIVVHAEDHRNLAAIVEDPARGGWGLDAVWADDYHHVLRRMLAGDAHGYYADFEGTAVELARTLNQGWLFSGQPAPRTGKPRGTDPSALPMRSSVICVQNHDQIGNRAMGDRLHHAIAPEAWRAVSTLLLTSPMTPLLFMGQEWAASTPFQYFTDLQPELGRLVTEGRRKEFADFPEFSDPAARERIPDPQAPSTFEASRLRWAEREAPAHARVLALYRTLLALRLEHPAALGASDEVAGMAFAPDEDTVVLRRAGDGRVFWIVARLRGRGAVDLAAVAHEPLPAGRDGWAVALTTEDPAFAEPGQPPAIDWNSDGPAIRFERPGAVVLICV
jgi:maltooligosyltrehalose trehalohydrolase